ncbi:hypothetical protein [Phosphitispora fastidiosa]|uniref:hypothetical protein n=1 Tax=Phosphitispora fastidiosa TaxID=2837202 RepID=UPI001E5B8DF6|nr:hypothetical protein [Phosphitispora fastidiosa]MBU7008297.1 hypothetical protein [Phosphitispora fastidiosa]
MVYLFIFLGVIFIALAVWRGRVCDVIRQQEIQEYRQLKEDLRLARSDVEILLDQLENVSEKVVTDISAGIEEAELLKDLNSGEVSETDTGVALEADTGDANKADTGDANKADEGEAFAAKSRSLGVNSGPASVMTKKINNTIMFPRTSALPADDTADTARPGLNQLPAKHQMVYAMERLGYPEDEIARQMNIGKGEVSLILQIKRKGEELNA